VYHCAAAGDNPHFLGKIMDFAQLLQMLLHVDKTLGLLISHYGMWVYVVLFMIIFCENGLIIFPFLPGDSLLFIAGAFAATGAIDVWVLVVLLIIASITGNALNYWIGSILGHKVMERDYAWVDKNALRKTHEFYEKHGGKTVVLARFLPIVRTFAPFVAGFSDMTHKTFQFYNVLGAFIWILSLVFAGFFFGNIPIIRENLNTIVLVGIAGATLPLFVGGILRLMRKKVKKV
jgi:membrane-associated protein